MRLKLKIEPKRFSNDNSSRRLFSFAVVDLNRSKSYPQNFVCMLPMKIGKKEKTENAFQKIFGDKSLEQAKALLISSLKSADDSEIRAEIERRLRLLEPEPTQLAKCSSCGKTFSPGWVRRFRRKFCPECMAKKYGSRN